MRYVPFRVYDPIYSQSPIIVKSEINLCDRENGIPENLAPCHFS